MSVTPSPAQSPSAQPPSARTAAPGIVAPALLVSLAATPCLLAIVALRATSQLLERVGSTSEEIFRGDRLPVIPFPIDIN